MFTESRSSLRWWSRIVQSPRASRKNRQRCSPSQVEILEERCVLSAGALDPTFSGDGRVTTDFGANEQGFDTAIQSDGKIVVAGCSANWDSDFMLTRFNPDGSLDQSFGNGGKVITNFEGRSVAYGVTIQKLGGIEKIVAVGASDGRLTVVRYNLNGTLDATFDGDGKVTTSIADYWATVARDVEIVDGKIVVAGTADQSSRYNSDIFVARYNANGSLDTSFGNGGMVVTDLGAIEDAAYGIAAQPDGMVVVVGGDDGDFALARYAANGSLDAQFGVGGIVRTDFLLQYDYARDVVVQPDGKIIAVGTTAESDFALARYTPLGTLDPTFGAGGLVMTDFGSDRDRAFSVALQTSGEILVAGMTFRAATDDDFALARYTSTGALDDSFGTGGLVSTDFGSPTTTSEGTAWSVAIQQDNKIVLAGYNFCWDSKGYVTRSGYDLVLARYESTSGPQLPCLSVGSWWGYEGDSGTRTFHIYISLSVPTREIVTVSYVTADGTATAGADYLAKSGSFTFLPGANYAEVEITVLSDTLKEGDEAFFVNISNATNATIADSQGVGMIVDDDQNTTGPASTQKASSSTSSASTEDSSTPQSFIDALVAAVAALVTNAFLAPIEAALMTIEPDSVSTGDLLSSADALPLLATDSAETEFEPLTSLPLGDLALVDGLFEEESLF